MEIECTLMGDGSSDALLIHPIRWLMEYVFPHAAVNVDFADLRRINPPADLADRIRAVLDLYPCDLLFIHRDTEKMPYERRIAEIDRAASSVTFNNTVYIPVSPEKMTEAWFLFDEQSIRAAAGNPNGGNSLNLPDTARVNQINDPKSVLEEKLRLAAGLSKRRMKSFKPRKRMHRLAELIDDFSELKKQNSFLDIERRLIELRNSMT